jgi:hypothetical protein
VNEVYTSALKKEAKSNLIILAVVICLLIAVLLLQSMRFVSSLWVLWEFGYGQWGEYLLDMLESLGIWAVLTGVIFSAQFLISSPASDPRTTLSGMAVGFVSGFAFTYFLVLIIGIAVYIPLGLLSLFIPSIIRFATLHFAWLVSAYLVFVLIAIGTPKVLFYAVKQGNWYFRLLGVLATLLLAVQIVRATARAFSLILRNSIWQTDTVLVALGASLLVTIVTNIVLLRGETITKTIFVIITVYLASTITGNVSYGAFHREGLSSILAAFVGPITYSFLAKTTINHGINAISGILGFVGGIILGVLVDQFIGLRIVGQGWSSVLCGTMITMGFGVGFGLLWGPAISGLLIRARVKPVVSFCAGAGLFLGIVVGMVFGGFGAK